MISIFALAKIGEFLEEGGMRILVVCENAAELQEHVVGVFGGHSAGMRLSAGPLSGRQSELLIKLPPKTGVTQFATVAFQEWRAVPRWSTYWNKILLVTGAQRLSEADQRWAEFLEDYVLPGGEIFRVWGDSE